MKIIKSVDGKKREVSVESYSCKSKKCLVVSRISRKPRTYRQILKHFGFERITGKDSVRGLPNFTHPKFNWYAEIIDYGYFTACWIVGEKIRSTNHYPGGKHCDTPEILFNELEKALQGLSG
jgi:hypothetical protein